MKALKNTASVILSILLLLCLLAGEAVALVKFTLLNPAFVGEGEKAAWDIVGDAAVRNIVDTVLAKAPPIALRTLDKQEAYALVGQALPPGKLSGMLRLSAPAADRFLFQGGDIPVLTGSSELPADEQAAVASLLMPEVQGLAAQSTASFPAVPFTPAWNKTFGAELAKSLWLPRYYAGFTAETIWLALAGAALMGSLLYLTWLRERAPFYRAAGAALAANGLLLLAPALAVSFWSADIAKSLAPALPGVAAFFGDAFPLFVRNVLWPFRQIFFVGALVYFSLSVTLLASGIQDAAPEPLKPWQLPRTQRRQSGMNLLGARKTRHAKP